MKKVLIIEDNEMLRSILKDLVSKCNFDVTVACDGVSGVKEYRKKKFDVVLTDLIMPNQGGVVTIEKIKKINPYAKIVLMSGSTLEMLESIKDYKGDNINSCLRKPFSNSELIKCLEEHS